MVSTGRFTGFEYLGDFAYPNWGCGAIIGSNLSLPPRNWSYESTSRLSVTNTFTWNNHGKPNDLPPDGIVIHKHCKAYWFASAESYWLGFVVVQPIVWSGSCDNGLSAPVISSPNSGSCVSDYYTYIAKPGFLFTVTCNPQAHVSIGTTSPNYFSAWNAEAGVEFSASIPPPATGVSIITSTNPSNPTPIVLTTSTSLPVPLSAMLTGPKFGYAVVKATLYDSAQNQVTILPLQPVGLDESGHGTASFTWDGMEANGTMAPPGVYLFRFNLVDDSGNVLDADKSSFLSPITSPATNAILASDDGTTATYQVSYGLASTDTPARSAAAGKVDVYDPNAAYVGTYTMQSGDLTQGQHTVSVPIPSPTVDGKYVFLASAQDNNPDPNYGHRWALQHNQKGPGLPPIVYIKSDIWHVAWCRSGKPFGLSTQEIAKTARTGHFITKQFQQGVTLPSTVTAASNGSLFSYLDNLPPIAGIGLGNAGSWYGVHEYAERPLFSFGMTAQGGGFATAPMKLVPMLKDGRRIKRYTVADSIQQVYPYGFGCVGLLVNNGAPVGYDDFEHQWNTKQLSPTAQEPRTALGWTKNHDFFIVTCNGIHNTPEGFQGKTWDDVKNFFVTSLPQIIKSKYNQTVSISGAVMLDGGGSTMFAYRNVNQNGGNIQTDQGAPQGYSSPPQIITDYVLAVCDTGK